jgi:hypothetical protein
MAARHIDSRAPLILQLTETAGTAGRCLAMPLTTALAAPFIELYQNDFPLVRAREAQLVVDAQLAEGLAWYADIALADMIDKVDKALLLAVGKNRKNPHYADLFGQKLPHEIRRASLERKLEIVERWVEPVTKSPFKRVAALGPELEERVTTARAAYEACKASTAKLEQFQTFGEGAAFTAKLNGCRKAAMGQLGEMPYKFPGEGLPKNFADWFFLPVRERKRKEPRSLETIAKEITATKEALAELEQERAEAIAKIQAEAEAKRREEEEEAEIAAAEKDAEEAQARAKALKDKRAKKKK